MSLFSRIAFLSKLYICLYLLLVLSNLIDAAKEKQTTPKASAIEQDVPWRNKSRPALTVGPPRWSSSKLLSETIFIYFLGHLHLSCPAEGIPPPELTWIKDGQVVLPQVELVMKNFRLEKADTLMSDAGNYTCIASNIHGSINWTYTVKVQDRPIKMPMLLHTPNNHTAHPGGSFVLECRFICDRMCHVEWYRHYTVNGTLTNEYDTPYVQPLSSHQERLDNTERAPYKKRTWIEKTNVSYEDAGLYTCTATNEHGKANASVWVVVTPEDVTSASPSVQSSSSSKNKLVLAAVLPLLIVAALLILLAFAFKFHLIGNSLRRSTKRVVIMRTNELYDSPDLEGMDEDKSSSMLLMPNQSIQVRIEGRHELFSRRQTDIADYILPVDAQWEFDRRHLQIDGQLGEGEFGKVMKGRAKGLLPEEETTVVAVKMLKDDATERDLRDLVEETELMKSIGQHRHIINLLGCCTQRGPLYVLVEYAARGNLRAYLRDQRSRLGHLNSYEAQDLGNDNNNSNQPLTKKNLLSYSHQIAKGMEYLASRKCIHRDLAARNVLIDSKNVVKIADFGLSRNIAKEYYRKTSDGRLPVKWTAPEALFKNFYTVKSDVWSYGILLWEIYTLGGNPYPSVEVQDLFRLLQNGHRMARPYHCSNEVYGIMLQCWEACPLQRPTFAQLAAVFDEILTRTSEEEYLQLTTVALPRTDEQCLANGHLVVKLPSKGEVETQL